MCGIIGYLGKRPILPILLDGLTDLEYRGYDSAGVAVVADGKIVSRKAVGKVVNLRNRCAQEFFGDRLYVGIGHTRWATHGEVSERNAHPHEDCNGTMAVAHNGMIENYKILKEELLSREHRFASETDTEVLAHLFEEEVPAAESFLEAAQRALVKVVGAYGLVVISRYHPQTIIAARRGSPLIIGYEEDGTVVASDRAAFTPRVKRIIHLEDNEIAVITPAGVEIAALDNHPVRAVAVGFTYDRAAATKSGFRHFMLKEIHEQPECVVDVTRGRLLPGLGDVKLGGIEATSEALAGASRFILAACGTSLHAAMIGRLMLESYAGLHADAEQASEFRYGERVLGKGDVLLAVSQSGETADTLEAVRLAKSAGVPTFGIVNVVGSEISRETNAGVYLHVGPEIGVASTKAFTAQVVVFVLLTIHLARRRGRMTSAFGEHLLTELTALPEKIRFLLKDQSENIKEIAAAFSQAENFLYLGRGYHYPVALEGALKMKEVSYIHAEGVSAAEMKHGPLALVDESMPVVCLAPRNGGGYERIVHNVSEVKARGGRVIAVVEEGEEMISGMAEAVIRVPKTADLFSPVLTNIPLQLLAYYVADRRGCDIDRPRNLAKSVTVE